MLLVPSQIRSGGRWIYFHEATEQDIVSYAQEQALNSLMQGQPFGKIISDVVTFAVLWQSKQKSRK